MQFQRCDFYLGFVGEVGSRCEADNAAIICNDLVRFLDGAGSGFLFDMAVIHDERRHEPDY